MGTLCWWVRGCGLAAAFWLWLGLGLSLGFGCGPHTALGGSLGPSRGPGEAGGKGTASGTESKTSPQTPEARHAGTRAGAEPVVVGLVDVGPMGNGALRALLLENPEEAAGEAGVDDDGNGFVDDVFGLSLYPGRSSADVLMGPSTVWHAEKVLRAFAEFLEGEGRPQRPVRVLAALELPSMPVLRVNEGGIVSDPTTIESGLLNNALERAFAEFSRRGVRVVNLSYGASSYSTRAYFEQARSVPQASAQTQTQTQAQAQAARVYGSIRAMFRRVVERYPQMLFVTAAGNSGVDLDHAKHAAVRVALVELSRQFPNVVVVSSVGCDLREVAPQACRVWGNFGARSVQLVVTARSTSLAAPCAAARAARLLAERETPSALELREALLASAVRIPGLEARIAGGRYLTSGRRR